MNALGIRCFDITHSRTGLYAMSENGSRRHAELRSGGGGTGWLTYASSSSEGRRVDAGGGNAGALALVLALAAADADADAVDRQRLTDMVQCRNLPSGKMHPPPAMCAGRAPPPALPIRR